MIQSKHSESELSTCETANPGRLSIVLASLVLFAVTLGVFWPACYNDFLFWDDNCYVFREPAILRGISLPGLIWATTANVAGHWHPLTLISLQLDSQLFGREPFGYHRTAVLLHSLNAGLAFLAILSITNCFWRSFFVASLFALHPLRVESVAWIAERKDLVSGFFFWLTIIIYSHYVKAPSIARYLLLASCFFCGLSAKSILVTTPFLLLLLDWWPLLRWRSALGKPTFKFYHLLIEKIPLIAISLLVSALTLVYQNMALANPKELPLLQRFKNATTSFAGYLWQTFWPEDLSPFYSIHLDIPDDKFYSALTLLVGITGLVVWQYRRRPYLAVGWFWFLGTLIPVSGLLAQCGRQARADRYTYLAQVGIFLATIWCVAEFVQRYRRGKFLSSGILALVMTALVIITMRQIPVWKNSESLWREAYRLDPDCHVIVQENLIKAISMQGKNEEAIQLTKQFILASGESESHKRVTFAMLLAALRDYEGSIHTLDLLLEQNHPQDTRAALLSNRGKAKGAIGKWAEAVEDFRKAVELEPKHTSYPFYLAHSLGKVSLTVEAKKIYLNACQRSPHWPLQALHDAWRMATSPNIEDRMDYWPICLAEQVMEAWQAVSPQTSISPQILDCLAAAYAQSGDFENAVITAKRATAQAVISEQLGLANEIRNRLSLYENHQPFRETANP